MTKKINLNALYKWDSVLCHDGIAEVTRINKVGDNDFRITLLFNSRADEDTNLRYTKSGDCLDSDFFNIVDIIPNPTIYSFEDMYDASRYGAVHVNIQMCRDWIKKRVPILRTK